MGARPNVIPVAVTTGCSPHSATTLYLQQPLDNEDNKDEMQEGSCKVESPNNSFDASGFLSTFGPLDNLDSWSKILPEGVNFEMPVDMQFGTDHNDTEPTDKAIGNNPPSPKPLSCTAIATPAKRQASGKWEKFQEGVVGEARCWVVRLDGERNLRRTLQGEIIVPKDLFPSFRSPSIILQVFFYNSSSSEYNSPFSFKYTVLVSLDSPGFSFISRPSREPIIAVPVVITSNCAPGLKPVSYAPVPVYAERSS
jgi:hypothetical protein